MSIAEDNNTMTLEGSALDHASKSVVTTDANGYIIEWTKGAERLFGFTAKEAVGQHAEMCYQRDREALDREIVTPLQRDGKLEFFSKMMRKSGEAFDARIRATLVTDDRGKVTGMIGYTLEASGLHTSEDLLRRYEQIVSASPDMLSIVGPDYRYIAINDAYVTRLSRSREDILGHLVAEFVGTENFETLIRPKLDASLRGESGQLAGWFDYPEAGLLYMDIVYEPVRGLDGSITGVAVSIRNTTERRRAEDDRSQQAELLERAERSAQVGHFRRPLAGGRIYWSAELYRICGVESGTFIPTRESVFALIHPDDLERYTTVADAAAERGESYKIDVRVVWPNGAIRYVRFDVETELSDDGDPVASFGVIKDVTETRDAELKIQRQQTELNDIVGLSSTGVYRTDPSGRATYVNDRWMELMGLADGDGDGDTWFPAIHPDDQEMVVEGWQAAVAAGRPYTGEFRIKHPNGRVAWTYSESKPDRASDGTILGHVGFILDITERKKAQAAIEESDIRYRDLYDNAPFAYVSINPEDGAFVNCNKAFTGVTGYSHSEVLSKSIRDVLPDTPGGIPKAKAVLARLERNEPVENIELQIVHKDRRNIWVSLSITDRKDAAGTTIERRATIADVTERKNTEEVLRESEEQLSTVTSLSPVALVRTDKDGLVTFVNDAFLRIYGREQEEMLMDGWADAVHPDDIERLEKEWAANVRSREEQSRDFRIVQPNGNIVRVLSQIVPVLDDNNDIVGHIGTLTDITAQKGVD
jgi:PAS domain S-box-containing protein